MSAEGEPRTEKRKWEYMGVVSNRIEENGEVLWEPKVDMLELGELGWELVTLLPLEHSLKSMTIGNAERDATLGFPRYNIVLDTGPATMVCSKLLYTFKRIKS